MGNAIATFTILNANEVFIEVSYSTGGFGMERVQRPRYGSLYEAAYKAASIKAAHAGCRLERFSEAA